MSDKPADRQVAMSPKTFYMFAWHTRTDCRHNVSVVQAPTAAMAKECRNQAINSSLTATAGAAATVPAVAHDHARDGDCSPAPRTDPYATFDEKAAERTRHGGTVAVPLRASCRCGRLHKRSRLQPRALLMIGGKKELISCCESSVI